MGIDIYARWKDQDEEEKKAQITGFDTTAGNVGYLREAYHGGPYVTKYLVQEAFEKGSKASIPASVLNERLPKAVALAILRQTKIYGKDKEPEKQTFETLASALGDIFGKEVNDESSLEIADKMDQKTVDSMNTLISKGLLPDYAQSFVDFVRLCELKEKETGEPCLIEASY